MGKPARLARAGSTPMTVPHAPLDAIAAALAVVTSEGMVRAVNAAFTELTGWSADALAGRRIDAVCAATSVATMQRALAGQAGDDGIELR